MCSIILRINNVTDSDGNVIDDIKASFVDVINVNDKNETIIRVDSSNDENNVGLELEINKE